MKLRFPVDLKARVVEAANKSGRTINAEVMYRLERSFAELSLPEDVIKAISETREMVGALHRVAKPPPTNAVSDSAVLPQPTDMVKLAPNLTMSRAAIAIARKAKGKAEE
jgi:hypothetical protein